MPSGVTFRIGSSGRDSGRAGSAAPLQAEAPVPRDLEALWCGPTPTSSWAFELLLNRADGDEWLFKRNEAIRVPVDQLGLATPEGVPFLKPEVVLLFKAKAMRARDRADFDQVVGELRPEARGWLHRALVAGSFRPSVDRPPGVTTSGNLLSQWS